MKDALAEIAWKALDMLKIELPSWGFANTGTRFGKFIQAASGHALLRRNSAMQRR